jgi:hypothetical protein
MRSLPLADRLFGRRACRTVAKHLAALDALSTSAGALYRELALRTVPLGIRRGTLSADRAKQISDTLNQ